MPALAHVVPITSVDGVYTYRVPDGMEAEAVPGARVLIPFGRRQITGVVAERVEGAADGLKPLHDVLDARPALTPALLALTRWLARYYLCAWGEAVKAALPSGTEVESRRTAYALAPPDAWTDEPRGRKILRALAEQNGTGLPVAALAEVLGRKTVPQNLLRRMETAGVLRIDDEVQDARARVKTARHLRLADGADGAAVRGERQRAVLDALAGGDDRVQADVLAATGATSSTVKSLEAKGLVEVFDAEVERRADGMDVEADAPAAPLDLHPAQETALAAIVDAVEAGRPETFLLHGVTGSGKTEVYLRALRAALDRGQSAIVLVPEIALTPQTVRRFRAHFGDRVAVLHSRMSAGERLDAWTRIRDGVYPIVIGPRSAIFAPVADLGLVVVDEEHEASYKQFDPAPRYHARDVAVMRAHQAGAACVLGSATPSMESVANANAGKYTRLEMPERVPVRGPDGTTRAPAPLPPVRVVDLGRERTVRRLKGALSHDLRLAIEDRLDKGEQTILLQNRRGYAPVLSCQDCGWTPTCRDCAVSLTVHKPAHNLRCHYCGRSERIPHACPECHGTDLRRLGAGTQRVEEEIAEVFPSARVLRMDLDTTSRKGAHRKILDAFGRGDADLLLGTQMVAKGLDFPRVTLVGVVEADTGMLLPDFRAAERTFQLLAQVGGRAGRHELQGEVILQTRNPEHPAITFALRHDFHGFALGELAERLALGYPPHGRLVGVEIKGPHESTTRALAQRWGDALGAEAGKVAGVRVLGPIPALIGRVKRWWRYQILLQGPATLPMAVLAAMVRTAESRVTVPGGHRVNLDVDPVGLY
ncbi:primosomal protein N' [Rubrivirga sp. IMCC45206]|uniref:replication restart helicase PriA n=1 Tax=Rubrivirga sp. IMCC45206 TaxID=3391614 RepID=UPI00398FC619